MIFHVYDPDDPLLQPYVQTIWYISQHAKEVVGTNARMIPDGCFHMVINLGDPHRYVDKDGRPSQPKRSHINAKQTEFVTIERSGHVEMMGVIFKPYAFYPFVRMPINELAGDIRNMDELMDERFELLEEQLALLPRVREKFVVLEHWLRHRLHGDPLKKPELKRQIAFAGELMRQQNGNIPVRDLATKLDLSERSLERYFNTWYGVSPKQYSKVYRIHNVLRHMHADSGNLVDYAVMGGFYDQSHFTRVFKQMVGVTPQMYLQKRDLLSDLYNTEQE